MRKLLLIFLVLLVVVAVGVYAALWGYVNSAGFRELVARAASESLNAEVQVPALGVALPLVVTASDIRVVSREGAAKGGLRRLELEVAPLSLFSDVVVVRRLRLVGPEVVWRTGDSLPSPAFAAGDSGGATTESAGGIASSEDDGQAAKPKKAVANQASQVRGETVAGKGRASRLLRVESVEITEGKVKILDAENAQLVELQGVALDARLVSEGSGGISGEGLLRAQKCEFVEGMIFSDISGRLFFDSERLELGHIEGDFFGGRVSGNFVAEVSAEQFTTELAAVNFSLLELAESRGLETDGLKRARASVFANARGSFVEPESLSGSGEFQVGPLAMQEVPTIAQMVVLLESLGVDSGRRLSNLLLESIRGEFELRDKTVHLLDVVSEPRNGTAVLEAKGNVGFDSQVDLTAALKLDAARLGLPVAVASGLGRLDGQGYVSVPFLVTGTTKDPVVTLDAARLAEAVGGGLLQQAAEVVERVATPENLKKIRREGERMLRAVEGFFAPPKREGSDSKDGGTER